MRTRHTLPFAAGLIAAAALLLPPPPPAAGYVEAPMSLGSVLQQSTNVCTMVVTQVDKQKNLVVYRKVQDIKGKHPQDTIKHNIGFGGLRPGEWQEIMTWAEVGKAAVFFHNGGASETYIDGTWYQAYPQGEWWAMTHTEPFLLRTYSGKVAKLGPAVAAILEGQEVVVPCMVDGDREALVKKTAKVQRVRASMKLLDYNPKRDFVGWGGEDIRRLAGMPGFDRLAALGRVDADAQAATAIDFDGDGKLDACLCGPSKVMLLQNGGDAFSEVALPGLSGGARAAVWADYDGDGRPDLFLATPAGPRLYTNLGKGQFRDDSKGLPKEPAYNPTAAAWIDADADGHPDLLLANGFHGLRLYRNLRGGVPVAKFTPPRLGDWYAVGPFRHPAGPQQNAAFAFDPEKDPFAPDKTYKGKRDVPVKWQKQSYPDGQVNGLGAAFGANCAVYLHRELEVPAAAEVPVSLGSRDSLTVWLNGEKLHADNAPRQAAADQVALTLKLKPGKNRLLLKVCHADGEGGFYFKVGPAGAGGGKPLFADATAAFGLAGDFPKGDTLTVADFNADGRPDFLYGAGTGMLFLHTGKAFAAKPDSGIRYGCGKVGPAVEDFDGDGHLDVFVPQPDGACKLFRNDGAGTFADVTASAGDLAKPIPGAVGAAWGDFDNDGRPDLIVCCLRGANRYFRNAGDGTFADRSAEIGLTQKRFNSQAACLADLNGDGRLDLVLANEGQDSAILFGSLATEAKRVPVTVLGPAAGGRVVVKAEGKTVAAAAVTGGDGRGGQSGLAPRFALAPGAYTLEVRGTDGKAVEKAITVQAAPVNVSLASGGR